MSTGNAEITNSSPCLNWRNLQSSVGDGSDTCYRCSSQHLYKVLYNEGELAGGRGAFSPAARSLLIPHPFSSMYLPSPEEANEDVHHVKDRPEWFSQVNTPHHPWSAARLGWADTTHWACPLHTRHFTQVWKVTGWRSSGGLTFFFFSNVSFFFFFPFRICALVVLGNLWPLCVFN